MPFGMEFDMLADNRLIGMTPPTREQQVPAAAATA
jgi:hypothetical protein